VSAVALTVEAIYENGVLKLDKPLPFPDHARVQVTVRVQPSVARESAGMLRWHGDWESLRRLAEDDEFGILESP
jgi:predicted DNA-binding antitoxin AbrB/MazE fold protein